MFFVLEFFFFVGVLVFEWVVVVYDFVLDFDVFVFVVGVSCVEFC